MQPANFLAANARASFVFDFVFASSPEFGECLLGTFASGFTIGCKILSLRAQHFKVIITQNRKNCESFPRRANESRSCEFCSVFNFVFAGFARVICGSWNVCWVHLQVATRFTSDCKFLIPRAQHFKVIFKIGKIAKIFPRRTLELVSRLNFVFAFESSPLIASL